MEILNLEKQDLNNLFPKGDIRHLELVSGSHKQRFASMFMGC